jgi:hypothetical protein
MGCPSEIASVLLEIIKTGLLRIRVLGWEGNAERCAEEADHLHNLPSLLQNFTDAGLQAYWHGKRTIILSRGANDTADFDRLWSQLARYVKG